MGRSRISRFKKNCNPYGQNFEKATLQSNSVNKLIKKKRNVFSKEIFDKLSTLRDADPKQYWKLLKSLKHEEFNNKIELQAGFPEIIKHFEQQGQTFNYDKDFKTEIENDISQEIDNSFINEVTDGPFTVHEINKCIQKLKIGKSAGPDQISNGIIKYSGIVTCKAITKLFNLILDSGKYPSNWRKSLIILIHKVGDKLDINNYRGISLQNCIAKLFSAAINCRIVTYYEDKFAMQQFGFRVNHRTTDSIFILKFLLIKYLTKRKTKVYSCFIDLRRAFATVWHAGLLYRLKKDNVGGKYLKSLKICTISVNFCQNRK